MAVDRRKLQILSLFFVFLCFFRPAESEQPKIGGTESSPQHPVTLFTADANATSSADKGTRPSNTTLTDVPTTPPTGVQTSHGPTDGPPTCPSNARCSVLAAQCVTCTYNSSCVYGTDITLQCQVRDGIQCVGPTAFTRSMKCQFCYQTADTEHDCTHSTDCKVISTPRERFQANCTVKEYIFCFGARTFPKSLECNWTSGYRWSTALILSITLGGFGVDRFYLGQWREGLGKLFSFGGLGVWTLVDVLLIAVGYLGPSDGSLYIY
ncbi:TM2 domain-containing protein 3 [Branchiostoma belcheri]|nr:TM2 domain-containing protein 3 [Branchiostoma belcheri]